MNVRVSYLNTATRRFESDDIPFPSDTPATIDWTYIAEHLTLPNGELTSLVAPDGHVAWSVNHRQDVTNASSSLPTLGLLWLAVAGVSIITGNYLPLLVLPVVWMFVGRGMSPQQAYAIRGLPAPTGRQVAGIMAYRSLVAVVVTAIVMFALGLVLP